MAGRMNASAAVAYNSPRTLGLAGAVERAVWYPGHEGTGTTLTCALGRGPDLTISGTAPWGTYGTMVPNGTDCHAASAAGNAELDALLRLDDMAGKTIIVGWRMKTGGEWTSVETICWYGRGGSDGGWGVQLSSSEDVLLGRFGVGGSSNVSSTLPAAKPNTTDQYAMVLQIAGKAGGLADLKLARINLTTPAIAYSTLVLDADLKGNGTSPVGVNANAGLALMAARGAGTGYIQRLGSSASAGGMDGYYCAKITGTDDRWLTSCAADILASRREFPRTLRVGL